MSDVTRDPHPDEAELRAIAAGGAHRADAHLVDCVSCREIVQLWRDIQAVARPEAPEVVDALGECPEILELVHAVDSSPTERRRAPLGRHLARCQDCQSELDGLLRLEAASLPLPVASRRRRLSLAARLRGLVRVVPPQPLLLTPRAADAAQPTLTTRKALEAYRTGDYRSAARGLRRAMAAGDATPGLGVYLGAALLMLGRPAAATRILEPLASPRGATGEAHWYLAQALLARGRGNPALGHLRLAARSGAPHRVEALALIEQVRTILGKRGGGSAASTRRQPS